MPLPCRGEIWLVNLNPTLGPEQAGIRPAMIISEDTFKSGPRRFSSGLASNDDR